MAKAVGATRCSCNCDDSATTFANCRRHGIMKWPRRELLKAAKAQKEAAKKSLAASHAGVQAQDAPLRLQPMPGGLLSLGRQATGSPADSASLGSMFATVTAPPFLPPGSCAPSQEGSANQGEAEGS